MTAAPDSDPDNAGTAIARVLAGSLQVLSFPSPSHVYNPLAVAQASDLIALLPASYLPEPPGNGESAAPYRIFELPVPTQVITISQMWHPRLEREPAHRWLRQLVRRVCGEE